MALAGTTTGAQEEMLAVVASGSGISPITRLLFDRYAPPGVEFVPLAQSWWFLTHVSTLIGPTALVADFARYAATPTTEL